MKHLFRHRQFAKNLIFCFRPIVNLSSAISFVFAIGLTNFSSSSHAQQALTIAATVNDEMISLLDVEGRLALSIRLADLTDSPETRRRLLGQTLRSIIDQKLKLQAAQEFEVSVTRAEIIRAERDFERRASLGKNGLRAIMREMRLDVSGFLERLESEIAWSKLVSRRYLPTIAVGEKEVDDYLADLTRNKGKPEILASEIFLPTDGTQSVAQVRNLARRLLSQIESGGNFAAIARNFSQSATAASGGNLGWHTQGQLPTELDSVLQKMSEGQVAGPIETIEGYYILRVNRRRIFQPFREEVPEPPTLTLHQAHLPLPEGAADSLINETLARAQALAIRASNCQQFDVVAKETKSPISGPLGTFRQDQLSQQLQSLVAKLPVNQPSVPTVTPGGVIIVMVCDRKQKKIKKMTPEERREQIRNQLIDERLNLAAEQYLRNLRRLAIVDVRL